MRGRHTKVERCTSEIALQSICAKVHISKATLMLSAAHVEICNSEKIQRQSELQRIYGKSKMRKMCRYIPKMLNLTIAKIKITTRQYGKHN